MSVNNSLRSSFCLICIQSISSEEQQQCKEMNTSLSPGRLSSMDLENVFQIFCEYMNFNKSRSPSNKFDSIGIGVGPFSQEKFPVCHTCFEQILEMYEFHEERKRLADLIAKYVYNFTAKIIDNPLQSLEEIQLYWSSKKSTEPNTENKTDFCTDDIKTEKDDLDLLQDLKEENFDVHPDESENNPSIKVGSSSDTQSSSWFLSEWIDLRKEIIKRYSVEVSVKKKPGDFPIPTPTKPKSAVVAFEGHISPAAVEEHSELSVTDEQSNKQDQVQHEHDEGENFPLDGNLSDCADDDNFAHPANSDDGYRDNGGSDSDLDEHSEFPGTEEECKQDQDMLESYASDGEQSAAGDDNWSDPPNNSDSNYMSDGDGGSDFELDNEKMSEDEDSDNNTDRDYLPIALRKPQRNKKKDVLLPKVQDDMDLDPNWDPTDGKDDRERRARLRRSKKIKELQASEIAKGRQGEEKEIGPNQFAVGGFTFEKVDDLYKCGSCEHSTATREEILYHIDRNHLNPNQLKSKLKYWGPKSATEISPNKFSLGKCTFEKVDDLYKCGSCVYSHTQLQRILYHVKHVHLKPNADTFKKLMEVSPGEFMYANKFPASKEFDTYKCGTCDFIAERRVRIIQHLHKHLQPNPPPKPRNTICEACGKAFTSKYFVRLHMQSHSDDRGFTCEFCAKSYKSFHALKIHLESHTGEDTKKFVCEVCGYKNRSRKKLEMHMATHYKGIIYPCDECDKTYTWPAGLEHHKKQKHDQKFSVEYPCDYCDRKFTCKSSLPRHIRVVHMGEKSQDVYKRTGKRNPNLKEDRNKIASSADRRIPYESNNVHPKTDGTVNHNNTNSCASGSGCAGTGQELEPV